MTPTPLTPRQTQVIQRISWGWTQHEIARDLHVTPDTVKTHAKNAYERLGAVNAPNAVLLWIERKR